MSIDAQEIGSYVEDLESENRELKEEKANLQAEKIRAETELEFLRRALEERNEYGEIFRKGVELVRGDSG